MKNAATKLLFLLLALSTAALAAANDAFAKRNG